MNLLSCSFRFLFRLFTSEKTIKKIVKIILFPFRKALYRSYSYKSNISLKARIGRRETLSIASGARISPYSNVFGDVSIGENVEINPFTSIYGKVTIKDNTLIAPGVMIAGGNYNTKNNEVSMKEQGANEKGIIIGKNCWIGANCLILDGVILGDNCIVAGGTTLKQGTYSAASLHRNELIIKSRPR